MKKIVIKTNCEPRCIPLSGVNQNELIERFSRLVLYFKDKCKYLMGKSDPLCSSCQLFHVMSSMHLREYLERLDLLRIGIPVEDVEPDPVESEIESEVLNKLMFRHLGIEKSRYDELCDLFLNYGGEPEDRNHDAVGISQASILIKLQGGR